MTATTPPGRPSVQPRPSGATTTAAAGGGGVLLLVGTRILLWLAVQLLAAGLLVAGGATAASQALEAAAAWWMLDAALVDLGTLAVIGWLLRRDGRPYRSLLGPPAPVWQVALGAVAVLAATVPAMAFGAEVNAAVYPDVTPPMFAVVDLPPPADAVNVLVVLLLTELAEPVAYLGLVLPWLEQRLGRPWIAAAAVAALWAAEHAFYPLLVADGRLDLGFAVYRAASVLPFLATWTALYYALGRRLLPIMAARWVLNTGTAVALTLG
jgi:Type II CAAX prenyl endopeptidase Rce1-like